MNYQYWYCEQCGAIGTVFFEKHADLMSVIHKTGDAHYKIAKENGCTSGVYGLRLLIGCRLDILEGKIKELIDLQVPIKGEKDGKK